jgi:phage/plasmid primase-like uncharacterized protein
MTNQIISRRLALANNPDEPIIRTDGGGFFNSETDLFLQATTNVDGKPRAQLTQEQKDAQDKKDAADKLEAEKKTSQKTQETIAAKDAEITKLQLEQAELAKRYRAINDELRNPSATTDKVKLTAEKEANAKRTNDIQYKELVPLATEIQKLREQKKTEESTEKIDAEKNAQSSLSNNLSKIDVLPRVNI